MSPKDLVAKLARYENQVNSLNSAIKTNDTALVTRRKLLADTFIQVEGLHKTLKTLKETYSGEQEFLKRVNTEGLAADALHLFKTCFIHSWENILAGSDTRWRFLILDLDQKALALQTEIRELERTQFHLLRDKSDITRKMTPLAEEAVELLKKYA